MRFKAVLFDLDGTLLNSLEDLGGAVNKGLGFLQFPQHEIEAYKYFIGDGQDMLARRALPESNRDAATVSRLIQLINSEYSQHWSGHTHPYDGVPALLDSLAGMAIEKAILSNKPHHFTDQIVSRLLSRWHFAVVAGATPSVPKKPDPAAALKIAKHLKIYPSEFLYLGDTGTDMKTAVAAGMYPVGALWGFREASELKEYGAKALIKRPTDLLDLL